MKMELVEWMWIKNAQPAPHLGDEEEASVAWAHVQDKGLTNTCLLRDLFCFHPGPLGLF